MEAELQAIAWHLPAATLTNEQLARDYPDWPVEKIRGKTGIECRHVSAHSECASDLVVEAARKLFAQDVCRPSDIDFVLFCTQSPDYFLPATACLLQHRLGIPTSAGAFDLNMGCSGFVYSLGVASGLIQSGQARKVLLLTGETMTKYVREDDRGVRTLFGDGGAATLIGAVTGHSQTERPRLGPFVYGTDGGGADHLIVREGGFRAAASNGQSPGQKNLYMNGPEVFTFTLRTVPHCLDQLLSRAGLTQADVDLFVFHQANGYMLEHLRQKCRIPPEKYFIGMQRIGNTASASIPIALHQAARQHRMKPGACVAVLGFGVGFSWAGTLIRWPERLGGLEAEPEERRCA